MPGTALDLNRPAGSSELDEKDLWHAPCQFRIQPYNAIELNGEVPRVEDSRLDEVQHGAIYFWRSGSIKSNTNFDEGAKVSLFRPAIDLHKNLIKMPAPSDSDERPQCVAMGHR